MSTVMAFLMKAICYTGVYRYWARAILYNE